MKLFQVRGGVKLSYRKELSSENPIVKMPTPKRVCIPLQQNPWCKWDSGSARAS